MRYHVHVFSKDQNFPATYLIPEASHPIEAITKALEQLPANAKVEMIVVKPRKEGQ